MPRKGVDPFKSILISIICFFRNSAIANYSFKKLKMNILRQVFVNTAVKTTLNINTAINSSSLMPQSCMATLCRMHQRNMEKLENPKPFKKKSPLDGKPFAKGLILRTLIKKPRKPNSANRKCVLVKLSTGKEMVAYVPGIGHNLQEHQTVLCRVGKLKDTPGVKIKCVRGKYDLPHVKKD